ncbi:MAG: hypothetical protein EOO89_01580 [Pedobacter sp.]|nr:MAG: hypothetical protein EOO89_01580 [Pedobacter sp.]
MPVIDRIELVAKKKSLRILNICGIACIGVWLIMVLSAETFKTDDFRSLLLIGIFWSLLGKLWSEDDGLFIEWRNDEVEFKTHNASGIISIKALKRIDIGLDEIKAFSEADEVKIVDIEHFTDYNTRLRIKENFTLLQKEVSAI